MGFWFFLFFRIFKPYDLYSILISLDRIAARQALGFGGLSIAFTTGLNPNCHNLRFSKPPFSSRTVGFPESGWRL